MTRANATQIAIAVSILAALITLGCADSVPDVEHTATIVEPTPAVADAGSKPSVSALQAAREEASARALVVEPVVVPPAIAGFAPAKSEVAPPASPLSVVDSTTTTGLKARKPVARVTEFETNGTKVWAWVSVENRAEPSEITMVWKKNGEAVSTVKLDVGVSPTWRTWSYKTLRKWDAGQWTVEVLDPAGTLLDTLEFQVESAPAA